MGGYFDECKECGSSQMRPDGGCSACMECGWSPC